MTSGPAAAAPILLLCTKTSPSGAPIALLRLASGLAANGRTVQACFLYAAEEINAGDYPHDALLPHPPRAIGDYLHIWRSLRARIRAFAPGTVITFLPLAAVLGCFAARLAGVPRRIVSHRVPANTYGPVMRRADLAAAWLGAYTGVIAVSKSVARSCAAYPAGLRARIEVIYNGLKDWKPSTLSKTQARDHLGLPADRFILVAVGRLDVQKNYPMLLRAMRDVSDDVLLAIAGDGADRAAIEAQIAQDGLAGKVRLMGALPRADIPHLLASADLFVQPSLFEGQSNALLEALYAGLPCFVSDAPEQVETVASEDGEVAGAILPVDDPAAWATAINTAAREGVTTEAIQTAIARQSAQFSYDLMMRRFLAVL